MHRISLALFPVDAIRTAVIVAVDAPISLALFRLMQCVPLSSLRVMHHILLTFFRRRNCATHTLSSAFIIQRHRPQQDCALFLTTQSEQ